MSGRIPRALRDPLILGGLILGGLTALFVLSVSQSFPSLGGADGRLVHAEFAAARQVNERTPVRVRGIEVGEVESVDYDEDRGLAEVAFRISDDDVVLHDDASAALRWRSLLGGRMELALEPGSPSAPELADERIPLERTRVQAELEDITRVYDGRGTAGQRAFLRELPEALEGDAAGQTIDRLEPGLRPLAAAMRAVRGERPDDLEALVKSGAEVLGATAEARASLERLVVGAQQTLRATANRRAELGASFAAAPGALQATIDVSGAIDETLPILDDLVGELRPGARLLGPALGRTRPTLGLLDDVLADARPLLAHLRPAVDELARASRVGRRLTAQLDPIVERLATEILPFLERADDDLGLPTYQLIGPSLSATNASTAPFVEPGHAINFPIGRSEGGLGLVPCTLELTPEQDLRCATVNEALDALFGGGGG